MLKPRSGAPRAPVVGDLLELEHDALVERPKLGEVGPVAGLFEARNGLPDLADRPALEREPLGVDDRLVADVERAQPCLLEDAPSRRAHAERRDPQRALLGERHDRPHQIGDGRRLSDRVARDHHHAALGAVADECRPRRVEQVVLVRAELEEGEGVGPVLVNELRGRMPELGIREIPRRGQRTEQQVGGGQHRQDRDQLDGEPGLRQLVREAERARLPEEQVAGLAQDRAEGRTRRRGERDHGEGRQERAGEEQRQPQGRRADRSRLMAAVERRTARPEERGAGDREHRLLDVQALDEVEDRQGDHQRERDVQGAGAPPVQVVGGQHERERRGHGQRVRTPHHRYRLNVDQRPASPGDVRGDGGDEVDDPDHGGREGGEQGYVVEPAQGRSGSGRRCRPSRQPAVSRPAWVRSGQSLATSHSPSNPSEIAATMSNSPISAVTTDAAITSAPRCHSWTRCPSTKTRGPR